ncbi:hypothetical protein CTI12_AA331490 [Artemisia annua]|uniref:Uncharacterized protein n=1 Tax=Artemisia annua TaxID=35608 RepID=A0A2U1MX96_ARTAN|nr:hypothetical protein CTI12_AA331490 [Artemisia annua]
MELLFHDDIIGIQSIQPFSLRHEETEAVVIKFESIFVHLPPNLAMELKKQVQINKLVFYSVRGTFKELVKALTDFYVSAFARWVEVV